MNAKASTEPPDDDYEMSIRQGMVPSPTDTQRIAKALERIADVLEKEPPYRLSSKRRRGGFWQ